MSKRLRKILSYLYWEKAIVRECRNLIIRMLYFKLVIIGPHGGSIEAEKADFTCPIESPITVAARSTTVVPL